MHILYFTAEQWPTFRADITVLFGKYLTQHDITCDLVTECDTQVENPEAWQGGRAILCNVPQQRAGQYIVKFLHQLKVLLLSDYSKYQAIQVRDMTVIALLAIVVAKIKHVPFYYWLSYPQSEGQIQRAKARGPRAGMRYFFPLIQGFLGQLFLYKLILPHANHIFVQSEKMKSMIAGKGIALERMTPVPMGVDLEAAQQEPSPIEHPALKSKRVLVYLGTLDRVRQIEVLFGMLALLKQSVPDVMLVLVGDTEDAEHRAWLKKEAKRLGVSSHVLWTGWLPMQEAWRYVAAAEIGLSPIPRGYLLDMGSPTKAVEYMALGIPVVMNDNPDQAQVALESGAASCVPLTAEAFSKAVLELLVDDALRQKCQTMGRTYVAKTRGYHQLATELAGKYHALSQAT